MKRRILHIRADGSINNPVGGSVQVIKSYINATESHHIENYLLLVCDTVQLGDVYIDFFDLPKNKVILIADFSTRSFFRLSFWKKLRNIINLNGIELIHSHAYKADFIAILLGWITNKRVISTVHGFNPASPSLKSKVIWFFFRNIWYLFDKVILVSKTLLSIPIFDRLNKKGKIEIVENSILTPLNINKRSQLSGDPFTLVSIGRLSYEKNHILLCEALANLPTEREFKCYLVGDGPQRKRIEKFIAKFNLQDSIVLVGFQQDTSIYYGLADVVVIPSLNETFSLVMLEAMSLSCPIIASRIGQMNDLLRDGAGMLFDNNNKFDLIDKIQYAMDHPDELKQIAEKALHIFQKHFSSRDNYRKLISIYDHLID